MPQGLTSAKSSFGNVYTLAAAGTKLEMSLHKKAYLLCCGTKRHKSEPSGSPHMRITSKPPKLLLVNGDAMTAIQALKNEARYDL